VLSIALIGVAIGLWTRRSIPVAPRIQTDAGLFISAKTATEHELPGPGPRFDGADGDAGLGVPVMSNVSIARCVEAGEESRDSDFGSNPSANDSTPTIEMLPGIAHPLQVAEISAAADGPLWKLFVAEGDMIATDTVMALIDNRVALASVIAAQSSADRQAMLEAANAKVSLAEQYLNRIEQAASKKAASGLEVDEAMSRLSEAKAALQEGRESQRDAIARLKIEQARLETYEIRAPFQGTVIKISPHLGETVSRGAPIVKIADINRLRAELYVPLVIATSQKVGEVVELRADLPNRPLLKAKIVFIAPLVDAATQTIRVVVEIENSDKQLPAGFAVRLSQTSARSDMH
jgi:RND family efflux transporter MFP subunit